MLVIHRYPWESDFDALDRFMATLVKIHSGPRPKVEFPMEMDFIKQFYGCVPAEHEKKLWLNNAN